jgi:hypothetical protein
MCHLPKTSPAKLATLATLCIIVLAAAGCGGTGSSSGAGNTAAATSAATSPASSSHSSVSYNGPTIALQAAQAPVGFQVPADFEVYSTDYCPQGAFSEDQAPCARHPFVGWQALYVPGQSMKLDAQETSDLFTSKLAAAHWKVTSDPQITDGTYNGYTSHETYVDAQAPAGSGFDYVHIRIFKSDQPGNGTSIEIYFTRGGYCAADKTGAFGYVCPVK